MTLFDLFLDKYQKDSEFTVEWFARNGSVYFSDELVILAARCDMANLRDSKRFTLDIDGDTWFVMYAAGDINRIFDIMPCSAKYAAFERDNKRMRIYDLKKLRRRIRNG